MGESERAVIKPEAMQSFIWVETAGGSIQQVEEEVALYCPLICKERHHAGMGSSKSYPISLPERVSQASLSAILDYCCFHRVLGRSNKERKSFDEKFVKKDTQRLCELTSAADALQLRPLVDLTSRALARTIEGKSPEEIREIFHLPDDLTEEEKLEPLKNICDDPRIRLLNRLHAKKRKELKEKKMLKNVEAEESVNVSADERSVDDLLSFINGGDGDHKCTKLKKNKRKTKRRKDPPKDISSDGVKDTHGKEVANVLVACNGNGYASSTNSSRSSMLQDFAEIEFNDDDDAFSDLDPGEKEKLDREIKEFERKLNDDWLLKRQQPKLVPNISNGSVRRYSGKAKKLPYRNSFFNEFMQVLEGKKNTENVFVTNQNCEFCWKRKSLSIYLPTSTCICVDIFTFNFAALVKFIKLSTLFGLVMDVKIRYKSSC